MATVNMIGYEKGLSEIKWKELIKQIRRKNCTPFIGAGACKTLPTGSELAADFAKEYNYPLEDSEDLQHVTQYLAITNGTTSFKTDITEKLTACRYPDFFHQLNLTPCWQILIYLFTLQQTTMILWYRL